MNTPSWVLEEQPCPGRPAVTSQEKAPARELSMPASNVIAILGPLMVVGCLAGLASVGHRRHRLRTTFGPEYDRVVHESRDARAADRELVRRQRRHAALRLRPIGPSAVNAYALVWKQLQGRFADDPSGAVQSAGRLVNEVAAARGYPADDCGERLALLSVDYAFAVAQYREAHVVGERGRTGTATIEELRSALAQYRVLFGEMLMTPRPARLR